MPVNGGVYRYGTSAYPTATYNSTNYYVDLAFTPAVSATPTPTVQPTSASASPTATPTGNTSKLIFGIGDNVYGAPATRMVREAPVKMITSWYTGYSRIPRPPSRRSTAPPAASRTRSQHASQTTCARSHRSTPRRPVASSTSHAAAALLRRQGDALAVRPLHRVEHDVLA